MEITIRQVDRQEVWELRHKVMWPDMPFGYIKLEDDDLGIHYGLIKGDILISVISLFIKSLVYK
jgi:hypothetical protein